MSTKFKRRAFLNSSLKVLGLGVTGTALANVCGVETGAQPLGPFFPREGTPVDPIREKPGGPIHLANDSDLTFVDGRPGRATGQVVYVKGQLTGRDCLPVSGATLIAWQASASGRYNHLSDDANSSFRHPVTGETVVRSLDPYFQYWGRGTTDTTGSFLFKTVVPGFYPADLSSAWYRPPHIHFLIMATGYDELVTQMYFRGDKISENDWIQDLNEKDFLLRNPNLTKEQRDQLVVEFNEDAQGVYRDGLVGQFNIQLK